MGMLTVACIQPARSDIDRAVQEAELVALCREKLTRCKIPDEWRFLDSFPRNAMGTIVKQKLRDLVTPAGCRLRRKIGRAPRRERECRYVEISVGDEALKKKKN